MSYNPVAKHNHNRAVVFADRTKLHDERLIIEEGIDDFVMEHTELTEHEFSRLMMGDFTPDNNYPAPDEEHMFRTAKNRPPR